jgi:hypothetical protein
VGGETDDPTFSVGTLDAAVAVAVTALTVAFVDEVGTAPGSRLPGALFAVPRSPVNATAPPG